MAGTCIEQLRIQPDNKSTRFGPGIGCAVAHLSTLTGSMRPTIKNPQATQTQCRTGGFEFSEREQSEPLLEPTAVMRTMASAWIRSTA